jgi:hypothetical protein
MARFPLRLVRGSAAGSLRLGSLEVEVIPSGESPPAAEALVMEDDTFHVLGAQPVFQPTKEHPIRVMTAAWEAEPTKPATVLVRRDHPLEILAVVYDLAATPPTREEWITAAFSKILDICEQRGSHTLAFPPLGLRCGGLSLEGSLAALEQALRESSPVRLGRLYLLASSSAPVDLMRSLLRKS